MEHTIYVTLEEFLQNGGKLNPLRGLFSVNTSTFNIHPVGWWDGEPIEDDMIWVTNSLKKFKSYNQLIYVEIKVIPIYE